MFSKLKQFKDLRDRAKTIQDSLSQERIEGSAGWGKVKITLDGNQHVIDISLDDSLMADKPKLQSLLKEAFNDGMNKVQKAMATKLKDLGGLDLAQDMQDMLKK